MRIDMNRTALFAALLALGVATGASAQTYGQAPATGATTGAGTMKSDPAKDVPAKQAQGVAPGRSSSDAAGPPGTAVTPSAAPPASGAAPAPALAGGERRFLENVYRHSMAEIEQGKLAQSKAQDQQVKDFAKRMVDEHTKANEEVKKIAAAKNVTLPTEITREDKRDVDKLSKKSGHDFDRAYMDEMVDDHEKDVKEFRSMSKNAKDSDVKSFASSTLPTLEQHLQMAKAAESAVKSAGKGATKATSRADAPSGTTTSSTAGTGATASKSAPASSTPSGAPSAAKSDTATTKGDKAAGPQK